MKKKALFFTVLVAIVLLLALRVDVDLGRCLDDAGNGKLYNGEEFYNYISYRGTDATENDIVLTVCVLNPLNAEPDDIIYRADLVVFKDVKYANLPF